MLLGKVTLHALFDKRSSLDPHSGNRNSKEQYRTLFKSLKNFDLAEADSSKNSTS